MVKIVDALPAPQAAPGTTIKVDTGNIAKALQQFAAQHAAAQKGQATEINPAQVVSESGERMRDIYARYEKLRLLGRALNGLSPSDNLPKTVSVDNVAITFRLADDAGVFGDPVVADIHNVAFVGDLAGLLATEIGLIIMSLQYEADTLVDVAQKSKEQYDRAHKNWEEHNKDRQIKKV